MTQAEIVSAVINGTAAVGSVSVAVLAIWGDRIRSWLCGPRLSLEIENPKGSMLVLSNGGKRIYYSLSVVNGRPSALATNCQVRLKQLWRRLPNGEFADVPLPYPFVMSWPPAEYTPLSITLRREHSVGFGWLAEEQGFMPTVRFHPNNFDGVLRANDTMRYGFEIVSDEFASRELQVFQVSWDGKWSENLEEMASHLQISEVKA